MRALLEGWCPILWVNGPPANACIPLFVLLPVAPLGRHSQLRIKILAHPNEGTAVRIETGYH